MKYIGFDCETGGIGNETSLLTVFFGIFDEQFQLIDELYLEIKSKDHIYHCTAEALAINGIDLIEHDKRAITEDQAGTRLWEFLTLHSDNGKHKLIPMGHNVYFDIERVTHSLMAKKTWNMYVSYRLMDLGTYVQALKLIGKLPNSISGSLGSICKHFGIPLINAHTAKGDTIATVEGIRKTLELMK